MILGYPTGEEVKGWDPKLDTFKIVRAAVMLPEPTDDVQRGVKALVEDRLRFTDPEHRATIEAAVGYGP